ncbi:GumC family protein [Flavobacterium sp. WC2509]|uniref:GumC family protein n=1 Tax=Flavobacterium sp. WC2509 TaxID=3461406 RepID=UPI0040441602
MNTKEFYDDDFENSEMDFSIREQLDKYLIYWKWFILAVIIGLMCAWVYLKFTTNQFQASTTVLVKDEKKGGMMSELSAFADLGLVGKGVSNVDNEVEILKSRTVIESTVRQLQLDKQLLGIGNIKDEEIYSNKPFDVVFEKPLYVTNGETIILEISDCTNHNFKMQINKIGKDGETILQPSKNYAFGEVISTVFGGLKINKLVVEKTEEESKIETYKYIISPFDLVVQSFKGQLSVEALSKTSSVVTLSITDAVPQKAEDFLNALVATYNREAAADKSFITKNTSSFISDRLKLITVELEGVEKDVEQFKKSNKLTDIDSEATLYIEGANEYTNKSIEAEIQLNVVQSLLDFMKKSSNSDLLPSNLTTDNNKEASGLIAQYNTLVLDRNRILKSATIENPTVVKLDAQINAMKANVTSGLRRLQSNLIIEKRNLNNQEGVFSGKINKIPQQERQFKVIARQQKVKEELYLYLLQKREETAITLAATEPNARVIDQARADLNPVSPKRRIVYLAAMLLGLLVPFGIIYGKGHLDNKITSIIDLQKLTSVPFVGDLPKSESPNELMQKSSRSSSAEALRIIRTNLDFMISNSIDKKAKTIFVTSTFPKEGKTFVSVNLAATFALSDKKILLIGMDIRNPKLGDYLPIAPKGLTNYLSSTDTDINPYIIKHPDFDQFFILPSGIIPPNPTELLMNQKTSELLEKLKNEYDYIIVDTAPVGVVVDTLVNAKHADCFVYVVRANYLEKRMLHIANTFYKDKKLPNMCMMLNDTDSAKGYGYGYGYGVDEETKKKSWYKRLGKK